jgi:hypothetical protein
MGFPVFAKKISSRNTKQEKWTAVFFIEFGIFDAQKNAELCFESIHETQSNQNVVTNHCETKSSQNFALTNRKQVNFCFESLCETKKNSKLGSKLLRNKKAI